MTTPPPYDQQGNTKVFAKEIKDTTRIVKAAVFNTRGDTFTLQELAALQTVKLTDEQKRTLALAKKLNAIINQYGKKNDALATAMGIQAVADANTHNGVLDKDRFKEDLAKYFIDQKWVFDANKPEVTLSAVGARIHKVGESPLAESLFGRERVGAYGWKDELQEKGNPEYNQAHHLAAYIIATIDYGDEIAMKEAYLMDKHHPYDIQVSLIATNIANLIKNNKVAISMIWKAIYDRLKED
jgi:hypothetical protein